ncbi:unnamed protein product [Owenia fusiformis]|uniref:SUEL-type lectin domain-containing protein n=1 Tax=Owenia fusiformis TaxID=6347 RepID=A0A8S4PI38_OWEFU|nr:unnamed protein product [Owenia fusiformis]
MENYIRYNYLYIVVINLTWLSLCYSNEWVSIEHNIEMALSCGRGEAIYIENVTRATTCHESNELIPKTEWGERFDICNGEKKCYITGHNSSAIEDFNSSRINATNVCYRCLKSARKRNNRNMTLDCNHEYIQTRAVIHGLSVDRCPNDKRCCQVESSERLEEIKEICDNQGTCNITSTLSGGKCQSKKRNYEQILYECIPPPPTTLSTSRKITTIRQETTQATTPQPTSTTTTATQRETSTLTAITKAAHSTRFQTEEVLVSKVSVPTSTSTVKEYSTSTADETPKTHSEITTKEPDPTTDKDDILEEQGFGKYENILAVVLPAVLGGLILVAIIVVLMVCLIRRKRRATKGNRSKPNNDTLHANDAFIMDLKEKCDNGRKGKINDEVVPNEVPENIHKRCNDGESDQNGDGSQDCYDRIQLGATKNPRVGKKLDESYSHVIKCDDNDLYYSTAVDVSEEDLKEENENEIGSLKINNTYSNVTELITGSPSKKAPKFVIADDKRDERSTHANVNEIKETKEMLPHNDDYYLKVATHTEPASGHSSTSTKDISDIYAAVDKTKKNKARF